MCFCEMRKHRNSHFHRDTTLVTDSTKSEITKSWSSAFTSVHQEEGVKNSQARNEKTIMMLQKPLRTVVIMLDHDD